MWPNQDDEISINSHRVSGQKKISGVSNRWVINWQSSWRANADKFGRASFHLRHPTLHRRQRRHEATGCGVGLVSCEQSQIESSIDPSLHTTFEFAEPKYSLKSQVTIWCHETTSLQRDATITDIVE